MNPKEIYLDCLKAIGAGRFEETVLKIEALEKEIKSPVPLSTLPCFRAFCLFQIMGYLYLFWRAWAEVKTRR